MARSAALAGVQVSAVPDGTRRRLVGWMVGIALALTAVSVTAQVLLQVGTRRPNLNRVLSPLLLGNEANVATWYAGALLLGAGLCAWLVASAHPPGQRNRRAWSVLAVLLVAMSADEVGRVHETLNVVGEQVVDRLGWGDVAILDYPWVLPGAVLALLLALMFVPLLLRLPRADRVRLVLAGGLFLGGALGLEVVAAVQDGSTPALVRIGVQNLEELFEMLGVVILIDALLRLQADAVHAADADADVTAEPDRERETNDSVVATG